MRHLILTALLTLVACSGCGPKAGTDAPPPLQLGDVAAMLDTLGDAASGLQGLGDSAVVCYVTTSSATALHTASDTMLGVEAAADGGDALLPAVDVDFSACQDVADLEGVDIDAQAVAAVAAVAGLAPTIDLIVGQVVLADACTAREWVSASLEYAAGVAPEVLAELTEPDGVVTVPEVTVGLSACTGGDA